jgi:hypothetical protein
MKMIGLQCMVRIKEIHKVFIFVCRSVSDEHESRVQVLSSVITVSQRMISVAERQICLKIQLKNFLLFSCIVVDFFNRINLVYGIVSDYCTRESCPTMSGGPRYEYR